MVEPTRHERVKINKKTFESFFEECGSYFARDINTSASEVWTRVINNETGTEVFESIEKKDIISTQFNTSLMVGQVCQKRSSLRHSFGISISIGFIFFE